MSTVKVCNSCNEIANGILATDDINHFEILDVCSHCGSVENTTTMTEDQYEFLNLSYGQSTFVVYHVQSFLTTPV